MNKDERRWIHSQVLKLLDALRERNMPDGYRGSYEDLLGDALHAWDGSLLTDRAKAVLAAVEKEMKQCDEYEDCETCTHDGADCPLGLIRDAWGGKKT